MSYTNHPEPNLNPPEDTRRAVCRCAICRDPILEGDTCYDIPTFGMCCTSCIEDALILEAEVDY